MKGEIMKVIYERKPFEDWSLEVNCTGKNWEQGDKVPCGSTLEIITEDLLKRRWFKYPNEEGINYGFICPICGCFTEIDEKYLEKFLKSMAKEYNEKIK